MPFAVTCSAAISAACHRPADDKEAHLLPVQWGVVGTDEQNTEYCAFTTSTAVAVPAQGAYYLGILETKLDKPVRSRVIIPRFTRIRKALKLA